jgi:hypothetical protein
LLHARPLALAVTAASASDKASARLVTTRLTALLTTPPGFPGLLFGR